MRTNTKAQANPIHALNDLVHIISTLKSTVPAIDVIKKLAKDSYGIFLEQESYHAEFFNTWIQCVLAEQGSLSTRQRFISNYYNQIKSCLESISEYELKARDSSETVKGIYGPILIVLSRELQTLNFALAHQLTLLGTIENLEKANRKLNEIALSLSNDLKNKDQKISALEKQVDEKLTEAVGNSGNNGCQPSGVGGAGKKNGKKKKSDSNHLQQKNTELSNELEMIKAKLVKLEQDNKKLSAALQIKSDEIKALLAQSSQSVGGSKKKEKKKPSAHNGLAKPSLANAQTAPVNAAANDSVTADPPPSSGSSSGLFGQRADQPRKLLNASAKPWPYITQEKPSGP